ncbi:MAG TPA: peptide ABC transporter substrate-binding protein [Pirellulales bacterium]|nr:peptide ABC transporter substrate-binding protein [Pirellulales bacterium]
MFFNPRNLIAWLALLALVGATVWALSFSPDAPADFTFANEAEVKSVDPAVVNGQLEGRIVDCLFEGLTRWDPKTLEPRPGVAESWDISPDKKTYTFHLRHDARWSDGSRFTAADFLYSHRRALDPQTGCTYSYIYYTIKNARKYNTLRVEPGDPVEIERDDRPPGALEYARGKLLHGKLLSVDPPFPKDEASGGDDDSAPPKRAYVVEIDGKKRTFRPGGDSEGCKTVLLDFKQVGLKALDDYTYQITLENPTAYFLQVTGMFPLYPVQQKCVETFGYPGWVSTEHLVSNGPFRIGSRKIRERMRLVKSDTYWGRDDVKLNTIDALVIESPTTALNLYLTGKVDWITAPPPAIVPELLAAKRDDFHPLPEFTIFFYRLNLKRPPLDNKLVRQALNLAMNKQAIVDGVTRAGEVVARSIVPPVIRNYPHYTGYQPGLCGEYDPKKAAELFAAAGYPGGRGLKKIPVLWNSNSEVRGMVSEVMQRQWKETLGIDIGLESQEWQTYLSSTQTGDYSIAACGWIGDYIDPNTFLDMFVTGGADNQTGWSNAKYDALIAAAAKEQDEQKRLQDFHDAEQILMDEMPVIPVFVLVTRNMVRPYVHGFFENALDTHPLGRVWVDAAARNRFMQTEGPR